MLCNGILFSLLVNSLGNTQAAPNELPELDIATTPTKVLFEIDNMKPGDWATRTISISNNGKQDFRYNMSINYKSGSKELYKELNLVVNDSKGELYNGKVKDFKEFDARTLFKTKKEDITFKVEFPSYLGNEFQGHVSEIEFKFFVSGTLGGILPVDGPKLPDTATDMFNIIGVGVILLIGGLTLFTIQLIRNKRLDLKRT
jgi:hypothetical protein